jgi:hypothetical protein
MTTHQGPTATHHDTPRTDAPRPRTPRFLLVTALTTAVLTAATTAPPWAWNTPHWLHTLTQTSPETPTTLPTTTPTPVETPPPAPIDTDGIGIDDVLLTLTGVLLLVLLALLARAVLTSARHGTQAATPTTAPPGTTAPATPDDTLTHLRTAIHHAQDHLAPRTPPRDAVVAAWVALEDAAALAGARRDPAQTPTEFTVAVLGRTAADPGAVTTLRRLYQHARFSRSDVTARDVETARGALVRLSADLAAGARTGADADATGQEDPA